jgi:hypothetical protein
MSDADLPPAWDWVTARAQCSVRAFFERLALGAQQNVATRMALLAGQPLQPRAVVRSELLGTVCSVFTESTKGPVVRLYLDGARLVVRSDDGTIDFAGTVTLDDQGRCRLRVGAEALDEWQVLKRALEPVLFPD